MRYPYHQMDVDNDDDAIEIHGNIHVGNHDGQPDQDQTFCPTRPLLLQWPLKIGVCEIVVGFLCAIAGAIEIFLVPLLISIDASWSFGLFNSFGASLWSGIMLILAGSCAVRASSTKSRISVQQFYVMTVFAFLFNLAMMILVLWSFVMSATLAFDMCSGKNKDDFELICDIDRQLLKYSAVHLVSAVMCLLGCLLLVLATASYFMSILFGEVQLLKSLGICCLPCFFYIPPSHASSLQSCNSNDSNLIV